MLKRYSKITMECLPICHIIDTEQAKYEALGIMPWHNIVIHNGYAYCYVWDTRKIELVIPENCLSQDDLTYAVPDNKMDMTVNTDLSKQSNGSFTRAMFDICLANREQLPILFIQEPLTDGEREILDPAHY